MRYLTPRQSLSGRKGLTTVLCATALVARIRMPSVRASSARTAMWHRWICKACRLQTSATADSISKDSHKPLTLWFRVVWWVTAQLDIVSALGLQRILRLGQDRTEWQWLHELRPTACTHAEAGLRQQARVPRDPPIFPSLQVTTYAGEFHAEQGLSTCRAKKPRISKCIVHPVRSTILTFTSDFAKMLGVEVDLGYERHSRLDLCWTSDSKTSKHLLTSSGGVSNENCGKL